MFPVNAYAVTAPAAPLSPMTIERRDIGPRDVLIEIRYCGICHSDIHHARGQRGPEPYPFVPGHEITGVVAAVGVEVTAHAVGDNVGVGTVVDSCGDCTNCSKGEQQYCSKGPTLTYGSRGRDGLITQGGYSSHIVVSEEFVLRIPRGLPLDTAAPLMCAGIATYAPLRQWGVGQGTRIAVIGFGGLGHIALQLGRAMGAEVSILSRSPEKRDDALRLGARSYETTQDLAAFHVLAGSFNMIINTVSARLNLDAYLSLLALDGTFVNLGLTDGPVLLNVFSILKNRLNFTGAIGGGIQQMQEMLDFCNQRTVAAKVEVISAADLNNAFKRMLKSDVRYRFVLDTTTLR
jgi:alcohol dehydrogenase (NADP+)